MRRTLLLALLSVPLLVGGARAQPAVLTERAELYTLLDGENGQSGFAAGTALLDRPGGGGLAFVGATTADVGNVDGSEGTGDGSDGDGDGGNCGAVVVYHHDGDGVWVQEDVLVPADGQGVNELGCRLGRTYFANSLAAVALPGDRVMVVAGARGHRGPGTIDRGSYGAVYAYVRDADGAWADAGRIDGPFLDRGDQLGRAVDTASLPDGRVRVLAGAIGLRDGEGRGTGGAFVVEGAPPTGGAGPWSWDVRARFTAPTPTLIPIPGTESYAEQMGWAVALVGDVALVGAKGAAREGTDDAGAAYVFVRDPGAGPSAGDAWAFEAELSPPVPGRFAQFGTAVALVETGAGLVAAVGEPFEGGGGRTHLFVRGGAWSRGPTLAPADPLVRRASGYQVSAAPVGGGRAVVVSGSRGAYVDGLQGAGAAVAFAVVPDGAGGVAGSEVARLRPSAPQTVEYFAGGFGGRTVSAAPSGRVLVGSPSHRRGQGLPVPPRGTAYVFDVSAPLAVSSEGGPGGGPAVSVWPNPSRGGSRVSVSAGGRVRVSVVDVLGREVAVVWDGPAAAGTEWSLPALAPGAYAVRAVTGRGVAVARVTVVR